MICILIDKICIKKTSNEGQNLSAIGSPDIKGCLFTGLGNQKKIGKKLALERWAGFWEVERNKRIL